MRLLTAFSKNSSKYSDAQISNYPSYYCGIPGVKLSRSDTTLQRSDIFLPVAAIRAGVDDGEIGGEKSAKLSIFIYGDEELVVC